MGTGSKPVNAGEGVTSTPPPAPSAPVPSPPVNPATAPASNGINAEIVPGVDHALFVEFVLETGKMDIPGALVHAQKTEKYKSNDSLMDWLMRPGTNIWSKRDEMLKGT